ncbi:phosphohydrolase [Falsiroseomonas selenitidurans]|uniref:Phosphohydrolase n=1 Tax=Falsiroseomonas selenitidurans TaxID=2716335 RepID=A0ABX1E3S7_9PROT|nr:phosphohydrolase [Falsiroseomonas selenitidurans]NKC31835.1 phosphohydrolase [Falsiroseomonas selenitidurans]
MSGRAAAPARAWIRLPSGRRLDLLAPTPLDWTDEDLAIGLSRTFRWGGHSIWPGAPLSVAQHSLAVMALRRRARPAPGPGELLRELLHDAEEGLVNFDCISPLKPFLGPGFLALQDRLAAVVAQRYGLRAWEVEAHKRHKRLDVAMAAAEAVHVAGWSRAEVRDTLGIRAAVMEADPLVAEHGGTPWQPWPPEQAAARFLAALRRLLPPEAGALSRPAGPTTNPA